MKRTKLTTSPHKSSTPAYAVFILTNKRPDRVHTLKTLYRYNYSGPVFLIVDDEDPTKDQYLETFGDKVQIFSKKEAKKSFDVGDNFPGNRGVIYARNASFEIAKKLGYTYFLQLDDDYRTFEYRFNSNLNYATRIIRNLDDVFDSVFRFLHRTPSVTSIAMAQGGDFIGGSENAYAFNIQLKRKCMNSFFCSTDRPFSFIGRINEDVNVYTWLGSQGKIFFTTNQISLGQIQTQTNSGGMTELYLDAGTYVKSFYSVMYIPGAVKVSVLKDRERPRLHHRVYWDLCVPKILHRKHQKSQSL